MVPTSPSTDGAGPAGVPRPDGRRELRADCARCTGLCCVAPAFVASADFAVDKPAGQPCRHLAGDDRCGVHAQLRERGFPGCTVFDCFGAGQHLSEVTFAGRHWRDDPGTAAALFAGFGVMRQLHELLWHLTEALPLPVPAELADALRAELAATRRASELAADELTALDVPPARRQVGELLQRVSEHVRAGLPQSGDDRRGADLIGADLRGAALHGAGLRGAYLIGADLRAADLRRADLLGADLRGADLRGADLGSALFLTQPQLTAARGDAATRIPAVLSRPAHWAGGPRPVSRGRRPRPSGSAARPSPGG